TSTAHAPDRHLHSLPTRRSSDLLLPVLGRGIAAQDAPPGDQGTPPAQDEGRGDEDKGDLRKRLEELEQKLKILERQKEVEQEVGAGKAKDAATVVAGKDGFVIKSADGAHQLKIRALLQSAGDIVFVERALPANLVPNRDVGLQLYGDVLEGVFSYALGVFNGVPDAGNVDLDTNDSKETAARIFLQPFKRSSVQSLQSL